MCVAAIIYSPVKLSHLKEMEESNPHGAGVAWLVNRPEADGGGKAIAWSKGLTHEQIWEMQESGELTYPYLMHFRWATHGPKVAELCHPFPLGPDAFFHDAEGSADAVLIHNGVWGSYEKHIPSWLHESIHPYLSDTQVAAFVAGKNERILDNVNWATAVMRLDAGDTKITSRGRWFKYGDNWYSNLTWLPWSEHPSREYKPGPYRVQYDTDDGVNDAYWLNDSSTARQSGYHGWYPGADSCYSGSQDYDHPKPKAGPEGDTQTALFPKAKFGDKELDTTVSQLLGKQRDRGFIFDGKPCSFDEYVQLKYGDGVKLTEYVPDVPSDDEIMEDENATEQELAEIMVSLKEGDGEIISEDPATVNKILARMGLITFTED